MTNLHDLGFLSNQFSEELYNVTEQEYDEVMSLMAGDDFDGYSEWSAGLEVITESENFYVTADGQPHHRPEPKSNGRYQGVEI